MAGFGSLGLGVPGKAAPAAISGYNSTVGVLSGTAPPNSLVAVSADGALLGSTIANASGQWSFVTTNVGGRHIGAAVVPFGTVIASNVASSVTFGAGQADFTVPTYTSFLTPELWGAGGGYGGRDGDPTFIFSLGLIANGGKLGFNSPGTGGTASGGDVNTSGSANGASPNGGGAPTQQGQNGNFPGGGAAQAPGGAANGYYPGAGGGYCKKTYAPGAQGSPAPGTVVSGLVGAGGTLANAATFNGLGSNGASGAIRWTWS